MSFDHWKTTEPEIYWEPYPDADALSEYDDWIDSLQQSGELDSENWEERSGESLRTSPR